MTLLFNDCKRYPVRLTGRSKQQDNKTKNKSWACTVRVRLEIHSRPTLTGLFTLRGSKDTRTCRWRLLLQDERKNQREPSSSNRWRASAGSQGKAEVSPTSKSVGTTETEDTGISIILKSVCVCGCVCTHVQETTVQGCKLQCRVIWSRFFSSPSPLDVFITVSVSSWWREDSLPAQFCSSAKKREGISRINYEKPVASGISKGLSLRKQKGKPSLLSSIKTHFKHLNGTFFSLSSQGHDLQRSTVFLLGVKQPLWSKGWLMMSNEWHTRILTNQH